MVIMYRQGDVLFLQINEIPTKNKRRIKSDIVMQGEATGHAHRIVNGTLWRALNNARWYRTYVKASAGTKIVHEEHGEIELPLGLYLVVRQREYSPGNPNGRWIED